MRNGDDFILGVGNCFRDKQIWWLADMYGDISAHLPRGNLGPLTRLSAHPTNTTLSSKPHQGVD
jgi:hypothetical protein